MIAKQELIDFEQEIVDLYHAGKIRSPVHLSGSTDGTLEDNLIDIFKTIQPKDWVFTTYRSHYHALLKGVPKEWLKQWILDNKSIHLMNKEHNIVSSAIVGGTLSQAVGVALVLKIKESDAKVYVFCGDMTASLGIFFDCLRFSVINNLPIHFVVENNRLSTDTPTASAWGLADRDSLQHLLHLSDYSKYVTYFSYERKWPHYGTGKRLEFKDDKT